MSRPFVFQSQFGLVPSAVGAGLGIILGLVFSSMWYLGKYIIVEYGDRLVHPKVHEMRMQRLAQIREKYPWLWGFLRLGQIGALLGSMILTAILLVRGNIGMFFGGVIVGLFLPGGVKAIRYNYETAINSESTSTDETKPVTGYVLPMHIRRTDDGVTVDQSHKHVQVRPDTSTLLCGATRSGKSEAAKVLAFQMIGDRAGHEPLFAYDRKDDWKEFFRVEGEPFDVLSADPADATVTWDLFADIRTEQDINRLARGLFESRDGRGPQRNTDEFFETAGRQVFSAICKHLWRMFDEHEGRPTNEDLVRYIEKTSRQEAYKDLSQYDDLRLAAQSLDPDADKQAAGVWANLTQDINDLFVGSFRESNEGTRTISLRDYFENPNSRAIVLSHSYKFGETVERIYTHLIEESIRWAMSRNGGSVLLLDELPQLPRITNLDELVNVGAGKDVRTLVTVQSVSQMKDTYGEEEATSLLAGMPTQILLRSGDPDTTKYYQGVIGKRFEDVVTVGLGYGEGSVKEEKRDPFDESYLNSMSPGECVITQSEGWVNGQLVTLDNGAREYITQVTDRQSKL